MNTMRNWMFGAAVVAGTLGMAAAPAQAAEFRVHERGHVGYIASRVGVGYAWGNGYYNNGYWVPAVNPYVGAGGPVVGYGDRFHDRYVVRERGFDRGRGFERGREFDRGHERFRR